MLRIHVRTGIIIAESAAIIILAVSLGWYYYHVQNDVAYTGDPLYDPNGYQTQWIVGTSTNNVTSTVQHSTNGYPTANMTTPFSIQARQMNSYLVMSFAPCARWPSENVSGPRPSPTCTTPAAMSMYIINSGVCLPSVPKPIIRESYILQYHSASNVLYESGNTSTPATTSVRFLVPAGDYCIIIIDTGQTDLSVIMNAKIEYTTI